MARIPNTARVAVEFGALLGVLAPVVFSLSILIQLAVATMVFFGHDAPHPDRVTQIGAYWCRPEHEIPIFIALCAMSLAAIPLTRFLFASPWFAHRFAPNAMRRRFVLSYVSSLALGS